MPVLDIAVDGSSYLVLGEGEKSGTFIWDIDKKDTTGEMIPYKALHPEMDLDDMMRMLRHVRDTGKLTDEDTDMLIREAKRMGLYPVEVNNEEGNKS